MVVYACFITGNYEIIKIVTGFAVPGTEHEDDGSKDSVNQVSRHPSSGSGVANLQPFRCTITPI